MSSPDLSEFEEVSELQELRHANTTLQLQLSRAKRKSEALVAAAFAGARDAAITLGMPAPVQRPVRDKRRKGGEEVALFHVTDWQGAKVTPSYNTQVMRDRVRLAYSKMAHLTDLQRAAHPVRSCVLVCGGDMVEGLFNFPTQVFEIDATIFEQWENVSALLSELVLSLLGTFEKVTVIPEWGNHGRIGSKRDSVPRYDNLDRMVYTHARVLCGAQPRLTWQECPEDIQRLEVGNYRALVAHGDEAGRNGYISPQAMIQHVNRWRAGAYPWEFQDCYLGHYHRHAEEPLADGRGAIFWTGSTESDNRYAREQMAASAVPSQRLHFIEPVKGVVTAQYRITLA